MKRIRLVIGSMKRKRLAAIVLIAVIIISTGLWWLVSLAFSRTSADILTSGFIEAKNVAIAFEVGGRITDINVDEGSQVEIGAPLVKLDDALLEAEKKQAEANLMLAQASLQQSIQSRDGAQNAWENARDVQLRVAEINLEQATNSLSKISYPYTYSTLAFDVPKAVAAISDAQRELEEAGETMQELGLSREQYSWEQYWDVWHKLEQAQDYLVQAAEPLKRGYGEDVFQSGAVPVGEYWTLRAAQLEMEKAGLAVDDASAAVYQAYIAHQNAVAGVEIAARQVEQAEAALEIIEIQLSKMTASSLIKGVVAAKYVEIGEIAQPGAPVVTVTQLDEVTLTAYVPEVRIGLVKLGQEVLVSVDSYPGESFTGEVVYISPEAQFTPRNVQLKEEREKTVFAVKIRLDNPEQKLKPGMPADARIIASSER